jgi:autoinducer 2-degrading protein
MYVVSVTVVVRPERVEEFIRATLDNARHTRREAGNRRFDVLQCVEPRNRFLLYEVYGSEADFEEHHRTQHYLRWKETVADWMAEPRRAAKHQSLFPAEDGW